jgi:hypothetical protein
MAKQRSFSSLVVAGVCTLALLGCESGQGNLSGKVTFGDKAVRYGSVAVHGSDGVLKTGAINTDGTYTVEGLAAGPAKIAVISLDPSESQSKMRKKDAKAPKVEKEGWFSLPEKYADPDKSGLTFDVRRGPNSHDIAMK